MTEFIESWRPITGYEDYYKVSSGGAVASLDRRGGCKGNRKLNGRVLKLEKNSNGQLSACLSVFGERKRILVSRLVANEFIRPLKKHELVFHVDGDKSNNRADNLVVLVDQKDIFNHIYKINGVDGVEAIKKDDLTVEKVMEYFSYVDGELYYKKKVSLSVKIGDNAGHSGSSGHPVIPCCGELYRKSHLIYFMHTGEWHSFIFPKNGDFSDCRIENLYPVSASEYAKNNNRVMNFRHGDIPLLQPTQMGLI